MSFSSLETNLLSGKLGYVCTIIQELFISVSSSIGRIGAQLLGKWDSVRSPSAANMVLCHLAAVHTIYKSHFGLPSSGWFRQYYVDANDLYITAAVKMFMFIFIFICLHFTV